MMKYRMNIGNARFRLNLPADLPSFAADFARISESTSVIGMIARVRVSLTVTAVLSVSLPRFHILSQVEAAAVTDEVSLIAVPAKTPKAFPLVVSKPSAFPSTGKSTAAITLKKKITEIACATSVSSASMTGAVAAIADPPQMDEPTPTRIEVLDGTIDTYEIEDGIHEIGEFAFARSALKEMQIPDGVTTIGYGAFYHCDSLTEVSIPDSVIQIEGNAFAKTPWIQNAMRASASYPYLVVGDGILLAYDGNDSIVNIPAGVKRIVPECFRDHMGITAVNLPDSLIGIGENAFAGCKNLKTVNGGKNCKEIGAGAFQDCL